jgi:ribose transport system ATP-binding protein
LSVDGLERDGLFRDVSFNLRKGDVLGIAGVIGSGREELARCLAGHLAPDRGTLKVSGQAVRFSAPFDATACGVGLVPAERKAEGLVAQFTVSENMTLSALHHFTRQGVIAFKKEKSAASDWIKRLSIKTPSTETMVGSLSGGNQQKVVLAKWRVAGVKVLILDHPTRGIDVGAKEDVYELIRDMTAEGLGVILLGDTLEEVIGLSNHILVMRDGEITARIEAPAGKKPKQVELVQHMV